MNKSELIDAIAESAELTKADAGRALDGFIGAVNHGPFYFYDLPFQISDPKTGIDTVGSEKTEIRFDLAQPLHYFGPYRHLGVL